MKSKMAGVALAAMMACGWASGAEAAVIGRFLVGGANDQDGVSFARSYLNPYTHLYVVNLDILDLDPLDGVRNDTHKRFTGVVGTITSSEFGPETLFRFTLITAGGFNIADISYLSKSGDAGDATYFYEGTISGSKISAADISVTTVPLPSSLPLLGTALLTLGGIGYGRRRKHKATAR